MTLIFAAGDDGIHHLRVRNGRRFASYLRHGRVRLVEVPEIDNSLHRVWLRDAVLDAVDESLAALARPARP